MAKLPTTLDKRPTPRAQRRVQGYRVERDPLSTVGEAIGGIGKMMEKKSDDRDKFNAAKAKSHVLQESIRIKSELEKDNDYSTWKNRYDDQMKTVKDTALNMVNEGQYREYLNLDIENNMARDAGSLNTKANLRQKEVDIAGMNEAVEQNKRAYILATDPVTRAEILKSTDILHTTAQQSGYVTDREIENRKFIDAVSTERANMLAPEQKIALLAPTSYKNGEPVFDKTKTWVDAIPPKKRMAIYDQGFAEFKQSAAKQEVRTIATLASNDTSSWEMYKNGQMTLLKLDELEAGKSIDPKLASHMRSGITKVRKKNISDTQKLESFRNLTDGLMELRVKFGGTTEDPGTIYLTPKKLKAFRDYQAEVSKEVIEGRITTGESKKLLDGISSAITTAVENDKTGKEGVWYDWNIFEEDPTGDGLDKINNYLKKQGREDNVRERKELFMRFHENLGKFDEKGKYVVTGEYESTGNSAKDEQIINKAVNLAVKGSNQNKFVGTIDYDKPPNYVVQPVKEVKSEHNFTSVEDMEAANLPDGTYVTVNGVRGVARK